MHLTDYFERLETLEKKLRLRDLIGALKPLAAPANLNNASTAQVKQPIADLMLEAREELRILSADPQTASIAEALGLVATFDKVNTTYVIGLLQTRHQFTEVWADASFSQRLYQIYYQLSAIVANVEALQKFVVSARTGATTAGVDLLEFEMSVSGEGFDFDRLATVLSAIEQLFQSVSEVTDGGGAAPRIAFVDSGSGVTIGVKANGKVVAEVRKLLTDIWRRMRYKHLDEVESNIESALKGVELLERVSKLVESKTVNHETGARLIHQTSETVVTLLKNATYLREVIKTDNLEAKVPVIEAAKKLELPAPSDDIRK